MLFRLKQIGYTLLLLGLMSPVWAQDADNLQVALPTDLAFTEPLNDGPVFLVPIQGMIDNALAAYIDRAIADAEAANAAIILFDMDTFGGLLDAADHMRKALLDTSVPTVSFINKNAASAGALISYAADRIVMVPGASIGAATVVEGGSGEAAPDKYQSYMRGLMRATAEAQGRDPQIAEAMVDETLDVPGVSPAGEVLTLSAQEALTHNVANAVLGSVADITAALNLADRRVVAHRTTMAEEILRFLASPIVASLLMMMMLGGLYFELQTPGFGFAGSMALVGAALFFAPHYLMGLAEIWEIALFFIGALLLFIEIFVTPGFGIPGLLGVLCMIGALLTGLIGNIGFSFPSGGEIGFASLRVAGTLFLLFITALFLGRLLPKSTRFSRLILAPELSQTAGYVSAPSHGEWVGQTGVALTALRPAGTAEINGERVDVVSQGDFIEAGTPVQVLHVQGAVVAVRPVPQLSTTDST